MTATLANTISATLQAKLVQRSRPTTPAPADAPSATAKRAAEPLFVVTWAVEVLLPELPFPFPVDTKVPPSPKTRYRSHYRYLGPEPLLDPARLANMSPFEVNLHLVDFSPLEPVLAQRFKPSRKGELPFHPVSMFLALCLRRELKLSWRKLAKLLAGEHGAHWRRLLGFRDGDTPAASTLRDFFHSVPPEVFAQLCPSFIDLLRAHHLCPERSTFPGDPAKRGVTVCEDGMLHPARHQNCCHLATDACYRPLPEAAPAPEQSAPPAAEQAQRRPCRARELGHEGCRCDTAACQKRCQKVSHLDPEARFVHYEGNKRGQDQETEQPPQKSAGGTNVFGYRSLAQRIIDDRFAVSWTVQSTLLPANVPEHVGFPTRLAALRARFPDLRIGEVVADAALGYSECLNAIHQLGALRTVDIRAVKEDDDPDVCLRRGYDAQGHPLCPHGYPLRYHGYDPRRRRAKWACCQVCRRQPRHEGETIRPVQGCPFLEEARPLGHIINVGRTLPDGSPRLARDIPYGSETWKARYSRRNHSESRNGQQQGSGLKRCPSYGLARNCKEVQLGDFVQNLDTMGRLVSEASLLAAKRGG